MSDDAKHRRFELLVLPHLDAALNLAQWLTHNDQDAQDVVQEACVRAIRFVHGFRGDNARPWLLQIVRNTCFAWLKENRPAEILLCDDSDEILNGVAAPVTDEPAAVAMHNADRLQINRAIACWQPECAQFNCASSPAQMSACRARFCKASRRRRRRRHNCSSMTTGSSPSSMARTESILVKRILLPLIWRDFTERACESV